MLLSIWVSAPNAPREALLSHPDSLASLFFSLTLGLFKIPPKVIDHLDLLVVFSLLFIILASILFIIFIIAFESRYRGLQRLLMANIYKDREDIGTLEKDETEIYHILTELQEEQQRQLQDLNYIKEFLKDNPSFYLGKK